MSFQTFLGLGFFKLREILIRSKTFFTTMERKKTFQLIRFFVPNPIKGFKIQLWHSGNFGLKLTTP